MYVYVFVGVCEDVCVCVCVCLCVCTHTSYLAVPCLKQSEQGKGNPLARMVVGVRLEQNAMVMALEDPYAEEGDAFARVMEASKVLVFLFKN